MPADWSPLHRFDGSDSAGRLCVMENAERQSLLLDIHARNDYFKCLGRNHFLEEVQVDWAHSQNRSTGL